MTVHEGKQVTGSVQYSVLNQCHYVKASMAVHEGK